jgi:hypothetical protein
VLAGNRHCFCRPVLHDRTTAFVVGAFMLVGAKRRHCHGVQFAERDTQHALSMLSQAWRRRPGDLLSIY